MFDNQPGKNYNLLLQKSLELQLTQNLFHGVSYIIPNTIIQRKFGARVPAQRGENLARGNNYTDAEGFEIREGTNIDQEALHKTWERFCGPGNVKSVTDLKADGKYFSILQNQKYYFTNIS